MRRIRRGAEAARKRALAEKENAHLYEAVREVWAPYFEEIRAKRRRTAKPLWQPCEPWSICAPISPIS